MTELDEMTRYAGAVRNALADMPEDERKHLLEGLDEHLAEVAAESGAPLVDRLGSPDAYASELRAAYGARARRPRRRLVPRRHRTGVVAAILVLLVVAGAGLAWRSTQAPARPQWSQARLMSAARAGNVRRVDITGNQGVATERDGRQHEVTLPADTAPLVGELTQANVMVVYDSQTSLNVHWGILVVMVVYLIIGLIILGSITTAGLYFLRQLRSGRPG